MGYRLMLTFKESEKWLYDEVIKHSGKGNWIKDVLEAHVKNNGGNDNKLPPMQDDFSILGDFKN